MSNREDWLPTLEERREGELKYYEKVLKYNFQLCGNSKKEMRLEFDKLVKEHIKLRGDYNTLWDSYQLLKKELGITIED
jgi:hypothetical protein